jgi:hypothetical protein
MATSGKSILIAGAGSLALLLAAREISRYPKSAEAEEQLSPEECIQPADVVNVFDDLFLHMQSVLAQLSQQIQQIQMSGQMIPEPQLRQLLKAEFERSLTAKQAVIFEKHDVDEDCLREATWEFMEKEEEYPKVKKVVERFQKLYEQVTGEKVVGQKPGQTKPVESSAITVTLSKEKVLEAATVYFDALTQSMSSIVKSFKDEGKDLRDPAIAQQLQMQFSQRANDAGESALEKLGVTLDVFKAAIDKHSSDPEVGRALAMLQMKQQQELVAAGVPTM